MPTYSQTNIQLYNQLLLEEYSKEDIKFIFQAYQFAQQIFPISFRPSGNTFISHLVETASILCSLHEPIKLITAGLLHAAYVHGDFGTIKIKPIPNTWRKQVRDIVGNEVEEYIFKYTTLKWNSQTIPIILDHLNTYSIIDRNVILIRLANELEDNLYLAPLYCVDESKRRQYIEHCGPIMIKMADILGYPALASEMKKVFGEIVSTKIPDELRNVNGSRRAYPVVPKSYRKRLLPMIYQLIITGSHFINKSITHLTH
jgi:(p)ppGpp synthase/HD superfamily hydrolase